MTTGKTLERKLYAEKLRVRFNGIRLATVALMAMFAFVSDAGIKYWDNPEYKAFDVGDYVSGAVWNYDGIRNVGANADHDPTALTWVNLGTFGSANNVFLQKATSSWPSVSAAELAAGTYGEWAEDGFVFKGTSRMRCNSPGGINVPGDYTIQMLCDAKASEQKNDESFPFSVSYDRFAFQILKTSGNLYWWTEMAYNDSQNPSVLAGDSFDYVTAIVDGTAKTSAIFSGTEAPTSGSGFRQYSSVNGRNETGYGIGCSSSAANGFTGVLKSFRIYGRSLSNEEVAWNRVVDEARFFGRQAPLPVTNVVVASQLSFLKADQPNGCYAVDASGFTFTAPATAVVRRRTYTCAGYTIETWDGTAWGTPVSHSGETSYTATDASLVRLTWQWTVGDGLVTYDIGDYVWDGLVWFYDGINNVGVDKPHSTTATTWKNLGSSGSANDVFVQRLNADGTGWDTAASLDTVNGRNPGGWTESGFVFNGEGRFRCSGGIATGNSYTLQQLVDVRAEDQIAGSAYTFGLNADYMALQLGKDSKNLYWRTQVSQTDLATYYPYINGSVCDYVTAILNGGDNTARLFSGTTPPDSGTGFKQYGSVSGRTESGYCFGGYGSGYTTYRIVGTLKNFRYYNHVLSQAELEQNRVVDNWRYFHAPATTNIVVATTNPRLHGNDEEGAYEVVGSYTFTAPATATAKNIDYACDGYTLETWDGSTWGNAQSYASCSYAYTTAAGKVRLTWRWRPTRGLRTAADYSFDDYSQAGLFWNYDGICNAGRHLAHSANSVTWRNIGSGGSQFDLSWKSGTTTTGEWADDGYIFRGGPRFWNGSTIGPIRNFTLQALVDANTADLPTTKEAHYVMTAMWDNFDLALRTEDNTSYSGSFYCNFNGNGDSKHTTLWFQNDSRHYDFATAMIDYDAKTAQMFQGVDIPTNGTGFCRFQTMTTPHGTTAYGLGNYSSGDQGLVGTLKSFRYYDRVLTAEEIVRNRNVDAVRYFGELGVTNVFVVAGGGTQTETGAYKVEGEWTFTATTMVNKRGEPVPVVRYSVETLVNGMWANKTYHDGNSYTYTDGTSPATVRLIWLGQPMGTVFVVR